MHTQPSPVHMAIRPPPRAKTGVALPTNRIHEWVRYAWCYVSRRDARWARTDARARARAQLHHVGKHVFLVWHAIGGWDGGAPKRFFFLAHANT